jgi:hypothetical protein
MRSPALAIAWQFRRRHLWALLVLAGYLLVLGGVKLLLLEPGPPVRLAPPDGRAALVIGPLSLTFLYLLAVLTFGTEGDLAARRSLYPARMLTLPVATSALAGWPMLHGGVTMASLWLATALFARCAWGIDLPWFWPALLGAVFLAWTQALTWMPYGLPGLRVIVTVLGLAALDAVVLLAIHFKASEPLMIAFLAPQLPLAYLAACFAVARARRGDVPDWRGRFARLGQTADAPRRRREPFPSPAHAQAWLEWRQHGWTLPVWVGILLPFELALLFLFGDAPGIVFKTLLAVLLTPPIMAAFTAAALGKSNPQASGGHDMPPFIATRPLTGASLVAAKLKVTILSTLATWLLVLVAIPLALSLSGTWPVLVERASRGIELMGMPRAIVLVLLGFTALLASTWKQLVQSLYIRLSGREWIVQARVLLVVSFFVIIGLVAQWIDDSRAVRAAFWNASPWILASLVCIKMSAAAWIAMRLHDSGLLGDRTLLAGAACWLIAVLGLYGLLVWLVATPLVPSYLLWLVAILAIPLARLSAAPLALAWDRHR